MKKKKFQNNVLAYIRKAFDRVLFIPIGKVVYYVRTGISKPSKVIEKWLSRTNTLLFISLAMAITVFIVIDQKKIGYSTSSAEVITSKQVNVMYDEDNYVVEGIPQSVDITLIGNKIDLYIAKQSQFNEVTIDLWGLKPGTHKVDIKYDRVTDDIKYTVNPSVATVIIYEKVIASKTLSIDLLNQDSLDQTYIMEDVSTDIDSVVIKGAAYKINQVATVKALVDMKSLPKFELGKAFNISSTLKAYDEAGNVVDVEISPAKVDVNLLITSPSKEVPIKVIPKGKVIYNMGISNIAVNDNKETSIMIYGADDVLAGIDYIPVEVDIEGLSENTKFVRELIKPAGVKHMSSYNATIDITLSDDIDNIPIENVGISQINLGTGLGVTPVDVDSLTVNIKGVKAIISDITPDDINVYVDLNGLGVGTHEVEIKVVGSDARVEYLPSILKMKVKIYQK